MYGSNRIPPHLRPPAWYWGRSMYGHSDRRDEGWLRRLFFSGRPKRWIYFCLQSKKATHLTSMLCLSSASADVLGCLNALCKLKVQGTSASLPLVVEPTALDWASPPEESHCLINITSSRVMSG